MVNLVSKQEAAELVGFHPESLMRLVRERRFPQPIKFGNARNCRVRFDVADIEAWVEERKAASAEG